MPVFKLPLSGDVVQTINPWTAFFSPIGSQFGLININLGQSSEPNVEADVLSDVASYGKQLGKIGDALIVLLKHFKPETPLTKEERTAIESLKKMLNQIADVKEKHERPALRPPLITAPIDRLCRQHALSWPSRKQPQRPFDHLFYALRVGRKQHRDDAEFVFQNRALMREGAETIKAMGIAEPGIADAAEGQIVMRKLDV